MQLSSPDLGSVTSPNVGSCPTAATRSSGQETVRRRVLTSGPPAADGDLAGTSRPEMTARPDMFSRACSNEGEAHDDN